MGGGVWWWVVVGGGGGGACVQRGVCKCVGHQTSTCRIANANPSTLQTRPTTPDPPAQTPASPANPAPHTYLHVLQQLSLQPALVLLAGPLAPLQQASSKQAAEEGSEQGEVGQTGGSPAAGLPQTPQSPQEHELPPAPSHSLPLSLPPSLPTTLQPPSQMCARLHEDEALQQEVAAEGRVAQLQPHQPAAAEVFDADAAAITRVRPCGAQEWATHRGRLTAAQLIAWVWQKAGRPSKRAGKRRGSKRLVATLHTPLHPTHHATLNRTHLRRRCHQARSPQRPPCACPGS